MVAAVGSGRDSEDATVDQVAESKMIVGHEVTTAGESEYEIREYVAKIVQVEQRSFCSNERRGQLHEMAADWMNCGHFLTVE